MTHLFRRPLDVTSAGYRKAVNRNPAYSRRPMSPSSKSEQ